MAGLMDELLVASSSVDTSEEALIKSIMRKPKSKDLGAINQSRIKVWDTCHRMHYYKYVLQLPTANSRSRALQFGTSFHWLCEQREDNPGVPAANLPRIYEPVPGKFNPDGTPKIVDASIDHGIYEEAILIFKEYEHHYRHDPFIYKPVGGKRTELLMELKTKTGLRLKGTADGFIEYQGGIWLVDHKTFGKSIPDMHELTFSRQAAYYYYLAEKVLGIRLQGIMWDYVRSKPPAQPRFNGYSFYKPSKQVLPLTAAEFMIDRKLPLVANSRYLQSAAANCKEAFIRIPVARDEDVQQQMLTKIQKSISEIKSIGSTAREPTISFRCSWCDWRPQCMAENRLDNKKPNKS